MTTEDDLARVTALQVQLDRLDAERDEVAERRNALMRDLRTRDVQVVDLVRATITEAHPAGLHRTGVHDIVRGVVPASRFRHPKTTETES